MIVLGVSGLYHDSAAAIVSEDGILAAAQEERFTRIKHDNRLPVNAIRYCLRQANVTAADLDAVVYYDKPTLTLDRYIHNVIALGEQSRALIDSKLDDMLLNRLAVDRNLRKVLGVLGKQDRLLTLEHHLSHAASAFYPSPFSSAAILTIDGVGEWATVTVGAGEGGDIRILEQLDYPHSLGLLYSAFSSFCGFRVNSGEYKFMGLAPYGEPTYYDRIREQVVDVKPDGSLRLNMEYFAFHKGERMYGEKFCELFGGGPRPRESTITRREMDIAASVQRLTEEVVVLLARHARQLTGQRNLVLAGGVALNCVANGKLLKEGVFDDLWIQPAADDAGGALGCALYALHTRYGVARRESPTDAQQGSYLGPEFTEEQIRDFLERNSCAFARHDTRQGLVEVVAAYLDEGKVVGWFQGRMEFGPRALGARSILGDPRRQDMQSRMNLKIKYRESFRPFAPLVLRERAADYFELDADSPYMLLVSEVRASRRLACPRPEGDDMLLAINATRSDIPAVTHVDYSARVQTVSEDRNPLLYELVRSFEALTGCGVLINTSFNVRGEPIVCTPEDAYRCFMRTQMDVLVLGDFVLLKEKQPEPTGEWSLGGHYELD